jgi:hypothetical protein
MSMLSPIAKIPDSYESVRAVLVAVERAGSLDPVLVRDQPVVHPGIAAQRVGIAPDPRCQR